MRIVYFDICAIVLSVTVLVFLLVKHYTKDRTNRLIITLSALIIASAAMDLFDSMFGTYIPQSQSNAGIQFVSNTIFYIIRHLTTPAYVLFLFSFMGIWHKLKQQKIFALWIYRDHLFLVGISPSSDTVYGDKVQTYCQKVRNVYDLCVCSVQYTCNICAEDIYRAEA